MLAPQLSTGVSTMSVEGGATRPEVTWWTQNPNVALVGAITLDDEAKLQLELLFATIDTDGNGVISEADFYMVDGNSQMGSGTSGGGRRSSLETARAALLQRELLQRWDELLTHFDFASDNKVSPHEFVQGFKLAALRSPLDATRGSGAIPVNHFDYLTLLNGSVNATVKNLCKMIFDFFASANAGADASLARVQAQVVANRMIFGVPLSND